MPSAALQAGAHLRPEKTGFERRVVLCGSMTFAREMDEIARRLHAAGVQAIPPRDIDLAAEYRNQDDYAHFKRFVSRAHISKVRDPRTLGILVANYDKHGVPSYIGPNTFAEIAIAFADCKRIFLLNGMPREYSDELLAWGAEDLRGDLRPLTEEYLKVCVRDRPQFRLPWS
jgi:hypothetical protein